MQFRKKDERKKNTKDLSSMIKDSSRVRGTLFLSLFFCACALSSVVDFFRKQASKQRCLSVLVNGEATVQLKTTEEEEEEEEETKKKRLGFHI